MRQEEAQHTSVTRNIHPLPFFAPHSDVMLVLMVYVIASTIEMSLRSVATSIAQKQFS